MGYRARGPLVLTVVFASALVAAERARAEELLLEADTVFLAYEVASPIAPVVWTRRRLVQTTGATYGRPLGPRPDAPYVVTSLSFRLERDFGTTCAVDGEVCYEPTAFVQEGAYQPLAVDGRVDIPSAQVELRRLPASSSVRLGRQLQPSPIGLLRLDGISVRTAPEGWFAAESYVGSVVRATTLLGTDAFAPQGAIRIDLPEGVPPDRVPFVEPPSTTWTAGGAVELGPVEILRVRAGFREVFEAQGVVARRAIVGAVSMPAPFLRMQTDAVWDLFDGTLADLVLASSYLSEHATIDARVTRHVPRFDSGTIWGFFDLVPIDEVRVGGTYRVTPRVELGGGLRARRAIIDAVREHDRGLDGSLVVRAGITRLEASGFVTNGDLGPIAVVLVSAERAFGAFVRLRARASAWHFDDPLRAGMSGTSLGEALSAWVRLSEHTAFQVELEHSHNPIVGHRFRGLASLGLQLGR